MQSDLTIVNGLYKEKLMYIRIKSVQKGKLALISASTMTVISLFFYPFFLFPAFFMESGFNDFSFGFNFYRFFMIGIPVFYFIIGYIGTWLFLALFNLITRKTGGFRVELFEIEPEGEKRDADGGPYVD